MLLKSRASLTCFRACFLTCRANDLSAPRYVQRYYVARSCSYCDHGKEIILFLFLVTGVDEALNNIQVYIVAKEMQEIIM